MTADPHTLLAEARQELLTHTQTSLDALRAAEVSIEKLLHARLELWKHERKEGRILARKAGAAGAGGQKKVKTSPFVILGAMHRGTLELNWNMIFFSKTNGDQPQYKRVPSKDGHTNLNRLNTRAAPEELPILRRHEMEVRELRKIWEKYIANRRDQRTLLAWLARQDEPQ